MSNSGGPVLHLGVLDQPYSNGSTTVTTGAVAGFLEKRYGVMSAFVRVHGDDISEAVAESLRGAFEALMMGQSVDPWGKGMQVIERDFRRFISSQEVERVGIPGVPTAAALRGVSNRFKKKRGPRRPSFRNTGLYMASMRAWVTGA